VGVLFSARSFANCAQQATRRSGGSSRWPITACLRTAVDWYCWQGKVLSFLSPRKRTPEAQRGMTCENIGKRSVMSFIDAAVPSRLVAPERNADRESRTGMLSEICAQRQELVYELRCQGI